MSRYRHAGAKGERLYILLILDLALDGGDWSASRSSCSLSPEQGPPAPGTYWIGGLMGLRAGLDTGARGKILCLCRCQTPVV
jgi:hypothetical protein